MDCFNCGSSNVTVFFRELFSCCHCELENELVYNMCQDCNTAFKTVGDEVVASARITGDDLASLVQLSSKEIAAALKEEMPRSMNEIIHRCLKCDSVAYEISDEQYECPVCGFSWGTI